jgi:hypothetical protein
VYIFEYLEYSRWGNGNENGDRKEEHFKLYKQVTFQGPGLILGTVSKAKGHPRQNRVQRFVEKQGKIRKELTKRLEKVKIGDTRVMSHTKTHDTHICPLALHRSLA